MLRKVFLAVALIAATAQPLFAANEADPQADFKTFRKYFTDHFPKLPLNDFVNGPYSMDEGLRKQWQAKEEFPPYDFAVDKGKEMFAKPFKNGKTYADCFPDKGIGVRQMYPMFDAKSGEVITLDVAINQCRQANGEAPIDYLKDDMASLTAYMAFTSRGKPIDIKIPNDPRALAAYKKGEEYFYSRRGQLNMSCASCHVQNPGNHIRTEVLAPALGLMNALPIYRSEWGGMGTTSRRLTTCNSQIRGTPLPAEDEELPQRRIFPVLHGERPADFRAGSTAMSAVKGAVRMRTRSLIRLALVVSLAALATPALAASADDFKAALAKAEAANKRAGELKNQWTTTGQAIGAAKKAADGGNFDEAVKLAEHAEALANGSIAQAEEQKTIWKDAVIH